jgi:hypothetical protein
MNILHQPGKSGWWIITDKQLPYNGCLLRKLFHLNLQSCYKTGLEGMEQLNIRRLKFTFS